METRTARNWRWEKMEKASIQLSVLVRHFELYNKTEGKSPNTIDWYNQTLKQFGRFLIEKKKSSRLAELGEAEVREFIAYLQERRKWQDNPYVLNHKG
ncbi:MAG: phage integrase N-terminal SAM-like domain-containing protein [Dehalococcoidia bacterium]|nr:phage integrase N-terminal SAM-like domain-containing protein [Dehalococcoidia bacterium]